VERVDEERTVANAAVEHLPLRVVAAVVDVEGLGEVDVVAEEVHPLGLDEQEQLVAGHGEPRLGGELDGGRGDLHDDGEGGRVDDGGAADVLLKDEELAVGIVDAAGVVVREEGDRGPGGGGRVGGAEEMPSLQDTMTPCGDQSQARSSVSAKKAGSSESGRVAPVKGWTREAARSVGSTARVHPCGDA